MLIFETGIQCPPPSSDASFSMIVYLIYGPVYVLSFATIFWVLEKIFRKQG